jgi:ribosomal protein S18 acetylase RimI-like enzyme
MNINIHLRPVKINDAHLLHLACWPERAYNDIQGHLSRLIKRHEVGRAWGVVSQIGEQIVGYGQLTRWGRRTEISDLIVSEGWRGHGVGTALIETLLSIAHEHGIHEVEIGAVLSNARALDLYRRLGFEDAYQTILDMGRGLEPVLYLTMKLKDAEF